MTVQTQGIMLDLASSRPSAGKEVEKSGSGEFIKFMKKSGLECKKPQDTGAQEDSTQEIAKENQLSLVSKTNGQVVPAAEEVTSKELDITKVEQNVMDLLKDTFGLSQEQLVDIMNQMGITPADLLFSQPNAQGEVQLLDISKIKSLVMEVHGVADETGFLTNTDMNQELTNVMDGLEQLLSKELNLTPEKINQLLKQGFSKETDVKTDDTVVSDEPIKSTELTDTSATQTVEPSKKGMEKVAALFAGNETKKESSVQTDSKAVVTEETQQVVSQATKEVVASSNMAQSESDNLPNEKSESTLENPGEGMLTTTSNDKVVNPFLEKLTKAFESLGNDLKLSETMGKIVEQVVSQVKVRVMPETTQMEMTLNPDNLGKVNISVTAEKGVATATLTVQNQTTKDALLGQMQVLKETFEQKGLRVESVEVNVSEFGFTKGENQGDQNQTSQQKAPLRKIRIGLEGFQADQVEEESMSASNQDTLIDYTA